MIRLNGLFCLSIFMDCIESIFKQKEKKERSINIKNFFIGLCKIWERKITAKRRSVAAQPMRVRAASKDSLKTRRKSRLSTTRDMDTSKDILEDGKRITLVVLNQLNRSLRKKLIHTSQKI